MADSDNDGNIDILKTNYGDKAILRQNNTDSNCDSTHWPIIDLIIIILIAYA